MLDNHVYRVYYVFNNNTLTKGNNMNTQAEDAFEPIGISCRICDRENCQQRAMPPLKSRLEINPDVRRIVPYSLMP